MNNKPVAYVNSMCNDYIDWKVEPMSIDGQPLYTHPADESFDRTASHMAGEYVSYPSKDLTDEEIIKELESEIERLQDQLNEFLVAKDLAILRKAQEK